MEKLKTGNLNKEQSLIDQRGWLVGSFAKPPFDSEDFEFKWGVHKRGETKTSPGDDLPTKTLAILVSGSIKLAFPELQDSHTLSNLGDYLMWEKNIEHSLEVLEDSLVLTIRWSVRAKG